MFYYPTYGTFDTPRATAAGGTAFVRLIPPFRGLEPTAPGTVSKAVTKITSLRYVSGATAHTLAIMRPFNYTTVASTAAAGQKVINITADPGLYSTAANWKYGTIPGAPQIANNGIASGDYCVYQTADGNWMVDTVDSVATLAITMITNVPTGGAPAGALFYFFGVIGNSDPNTGLVNPQWITNASNDETWSNPTGLYTALHKGDPLLFYSPNGTNAGVLEHCSGVYAKF